MRQQWLKKVYEEIQRGLKIGTIESIHGSLLALGELLEKRGSFALEGKFREVSDLVLRYKDHKDAGIRKTVIVLIPQLAFFDPSDFVNIHLKSVFQYLLSPSRKDKERFIGK